MGEKIVLGPLTKGLRNDVTAFNIDNDAFPTMQNFYHWRGRVKRKRGTSPLTRLQRFFNSANTSYGLTSSFSLSGDAGNLLTGFNLQANGSIIPGSATFPIQFNVGATTYTDTAGTGTLSGGSGGTINYATGAINITGGGSGTVSAATFYYYPVLPVMGLRDLVVPSSQFLSTLGFDTTYAYNILPSNPFNSYDVSFYKNPPTASYPGYVQKTNPTPTSWNGQDYQQFWSINNQDAFWVTNGINVPFSITNVGMQFAPSSTITYVSNTATTLTVSITNCPLVIGDFVFANEWTGGATATGLNLQTGYVTAAAPNTPPLANKTLTITFPNASLGAGPFTPGILQYLTNRSDTTKDCLRWYDGDPTNGSPTSPSLNGNLGWVNFAPPLSLGAFSISDEPDAVYYLIGARSIISYKDRLLFFAPVIQTSSANSQIYLNDTVIFSQNGTPYYTASFSGSSSSAATAFTSILVPAGQTGFPNAYIEDQTGFGGSISADIDQNILSVTPYKDVLIIGFNRRFARLVYTGNDILPFNFYMINEEYGSGVISSSITMDNGIVTMGSRGFINASEVSAGRFDLVIPEEIFQVRLQQNGADRLTAARDFDSEWIYFTYPLNNSQWRFPSQTLLYNYRDNSWGLFVENYTSYGNFAIQSGLTWGTVGQTFPTWKQWNQPWNASQTTIGQPIIIAGNQQGFVVQRNVSTTGEASSLQIQNISGSTITSPDHCLNVGDFIVINNCIGTVASSVNGKVFQVAITTQNTFVLNPGISLGLTYVGGGTITRMYRPYLQSKQFPTSWGLGRKTRLGPQQYLFTTTPGPTTQIQLLIFLSTDPGNPYNVSDITPNPNTINSSLIYTSVLYTCVESTNIGLTPVNTNLQMISFISPNGLGAFTPQAQTWHRVNTSLIGDTVQIGFTLTDDQMRDPNFINQFAEIEFHSAVLDVNPSQLLA